MLRLKRFDHRLFPTPTGERLLGYARGQLLAAGPEEFVRQDVLRTLVEEYGYPRESLLAEEPVARGTKNRKRADVLVRLPRQELGVATVGDEAKADLPEWPPYSESVARVSALFPGLDSISFPDVPDTLPLEVDGRSVECATSAFFVAEHGVTLLLTPGSNRVPGEFPRQLLPRVLGYGMTSMETKLAALLKLENLQPIGPECENLLDLVNATLSLLGHGANGAAALSIDGESGWVLIGRANNLTYVLAFVDTSTDDWRRFHGRAMEKKPKLPFFDGRIADRTSLHRLKLGTAVAVMGPFGEWEEGDVVDIAGDKVTVRAEWGTLEASMKFHVGENWIMGILTDPEAIAPASQVPTNGDARDFIVVECKAPNIALTEEVLRQGLDYARTRRASFLVLANGSEARSFHLDEDGEHPVEDIPDYGTAVSSDTFEVAALRTLDLEAPVLPATARTRPDLRSLHARARFSTIGLDLPEERWWQVLILEDVLRRTPDLASTTYAAHGVEIIEDLGLRFHQPGNAGGGKWAGMFRDFVVRDEAGAERIIGFMVAASGKHVGDHHWGNRRGKSVLMVALSTGAIYASTIQMDLGRCLGVESNLIHVSHSGRMTAGRGGVKNQRVLDFVEERHPLLVRDKKIDLGHIPARSDVDWDEMKDFVARTTAYALAREELKRQVKSERKTKRRAK